MNSKDFDRYLSENEVKPTYIIMYPLVWNGYWRMNRGNPFIRKIFRILGHKLNSKRIYWMGRPIRWETGMKEFIKDTEFYDIYS